MSIRVYGHVDLGGIKRKIKRAQQKRANKLVERQLRRVQEQMDAMPDTCSKCDKIFDKHDRTMTATWKISLVDNNISLTCPSCDIPD